MLTAQGHVSPITKKSETCFILERRRLNCRRVHCSTNRRRIILDVCLLFDAPPPMGILVTGCTLKLARIWQQHCQDGDHTYINIYKAKWRSYIQLYLPIKIGKDLVSNNYYTKNNCHLTQSLYTAMKFSLWTNDLQHAECC
jgi:hypothetical protein